MVHENFRWQSPIQTALYIVRQINPDIKGEDVATMLLNYECGGTSVVDCSYATQRMPETFPQSLLEIDGPKGTLRLDVGYQLTVQSKSEIKRDVSPPLLTWAEQPWHNIQESVQSIQQNFSDCITKGIEPATSSTDDLKTLAAVEAAYQSSARGCTINLADI